MQTWNRFEHELSRPAKRQSRLKKEIKSARDAAQRLAAAIEGLSVEALELFADEMSPDDHDLFRIRRGGSRKFPETSATGLLFAARDSSILLNYRASHVDISAARLRDNRFRLRNQIERKQDILNQLMIVWMQGAGGTQGSRKFHRFVELVMNDIDRQFTSAYDWRRMPKVEKRALSYLTFKETPRNEV
ncbi:MAG: hypothetical protein IPK00_10435 [Deltaproteobacteria bacterium]|nr:hypothetical protein [Deltaproteobacteria bacterium]